MPTDKLSVLWIDDQIAGLSTFVEALKKAGFNVEPASGTADGLRVAQMRDFDIYLVDLRMPPPDGIECLRSLHRLNPRGRFASLSSFHYLERYRRRLEALDFRVQLMDKDFPDALSSDFSNHFIAPICKLAEEGVTMTIHDEKSVLADVPKDNPFDIPLANFNKLSLMVKDNLKRQAGKIAHDVVQKAFEEGNIWVMLCGNPQVIHAKASCLDEIPSDHDIAEFAVNQGRPVFQFWSQVSVDDMWSPCAVDNRASYYPTVSLQFGLHKVRVHFDTGAPYSFFSYEELRALEVVPPTTDWNEAWRKGVPEPYWSRRLKLEAELHCQETGQSQLVSITGQFVRDWEASPYARHCAKACPGGDTVNGEPKLCPDRKGLVGRNLLIENALVIVLDGRKRITGFKS
jgi:CheY-like chemotaxis protein